MRWLRQFGIVLLAFAVFAYLVIDLILILRADEQDHNPIDRPLRHVGGPLTPMVSYSKKPIRGGPGLQSLGSTCPLHPLPVVKDSLARKSGRNISNFSVKPATGVINSRHAIVLDAGSTGSRIHIYEFQFCSDRLLVLSDEVFEEVKPGLSHYHGNPVEAARSLQPLLETALERVPSFLHKCTPLTLRATAGLRLLPERTVQEILSNVQQWLHTHPFVIGDGQKDLIDQHVGVMDGSEEAVLAWVTVNFLQRQQQGHFKVPPVEETAIVLDLGGGSTQIVFAVPADNVGSVDNYYKVHFHQTLYQLYQHSYLGFGLMEARKKIKQLAIKKQNQNNNVPFACYPKGHSEQFEGVTLSGSSGGWQACLELVQGIFGKEEPCSVPPCAFAGVHQPRFKDGRSQRRPIVAFSYIYDRIAPLGLASSTITLREISQAGIGLCKGDRYGQLLAQLPEWCMDLVYTHALLSYGYEIDLDHPITITKQLGGYEAGWALGSALKLLEKSTISCPVYPHFFK